MTSSEEVLMTFPGVTGPAAQLCTVATFVQGQTGALKYAPEQAVGTLTPDYVKALQVKQGGTLHARCERHFLPFTIERESSLKVLGKVTDLASAVIPDVLRPAIDKLTNLFIGEGSIEIKILIPLQVECEVLTVEYFDEKGKQQKETHFRSARISPDTATAAQNQWQEPAELVVKGIGNLRTGAPYVRFDWNLFTAGRRLRSQASQTQGSITVVAGSGAPECASTGASGATKLTPGSPGAVEQVDMPEITPAESIGGKRTQNQRTLLLSAGGTLAERGREGLRKHVKARYGVRLSDAVAQAVVEEAFRAYEPAEWLLFLARLVGRTTFSSSVFAPLFALTKIEPSDKGVAELAKSIEALLDKQFGSYREKMLDSPTASKSADDRRKEAVRVAEVYVRRITRDIGILRRDAQAATPQIGRLADDAVKAALVRRHGRIRSTCYTGAVEIVRAFAGVLYGEAEELLRPGAVEGLQPDEAALYTVLATPPGSKDELMTDESRRELWTALVNLAEDLAWTGGKKIRPRRTASQ